MINSNKPVWVYLTKGTVFALATLGVKLLTSLSCLTIYSQDGIVSDIPNFAISIVMFISSLLIYNSAFGLIFSFDRDSCDEYLAASDEMDKSTPAFTRLYNYKSFIATAAPIVAVLSIAAILGASWEIMGMFHFGDGKSAYSKGFIPFLLNIVLISAFVLYERYEAVRYWKMLKRSGNLEETSSKAKIIFRVIFVVVVYPLFLPYLPMIAFVFISFISTLAVLLTAPVLALIFVAIILVIVAIMILARIRSRKKLFVRIKTIAREHRYEISEITNPYASLFSRKKSCTFTMKRGRSTFDCLIIGHIRRSVPICFTSDHEGYYRHRIGTRKHNITMEKHFEYSAPGDGKKIMIIHPTPKYAYLCDPQFKKEKRVYNADCVWSFVAYEDEAFIGAVDRDCLGRSTSVPESTEVQVPIRKIGRLH